MSSDDRTKPVNICRCTKARFVDIDTGACRDCGRQPLMKGLGVPRPLYARLIALADTLPNRATISDAIDFAVTYWEQERERYQEEEASKGGPPSSLPKPPKSKPSKR